MCTGDGQRHGRWTPIPTCWRDTQRTTVLSRDQSQRQAHSDSNISGISTVRRTSLHAGRRVTPDRETRQLGNSFEYDFPTHQPPSFAVGAKIRSTSDSLSGTFSSADREQQAYQSSIRMHARHCRAEWSRSTISNGLVVRTAELYAKR